MPTPRELLDRLDSRHDELIRKLDELNAQVEQALAEIVKSRLLPVGHHFPGVTVYDDDGLQRAA
jgi:hypothetical protein